MKVAIVGSRRYENKRKIKEFIFKLKNEYGEKTIIVSGGCKDGADKYAKKYALELGLQYDKTKKEIYAFRDNTGQKPLYYFLKNNQIIFCSEINPIFQTVKEKVEINSKIKNIYFFNSKLLNAFYNARQNII